MSRISRTALPAFAAGCTLMIAALGPTPTAAQAPTVPLGDSLDLLLRTAEAQHYRGALAEARATLDLADSVAARHSLASASLARVWIARAEVWISQTTATNTGYAEADSAAAQALRIAERSREPRLIADAADVAGRVLYSRRINLAEGDYDQPLAHFNRALELRRTARDTGGIVESMFRVGLIHERRDESARAVSIYQEAMRLAGTSYPLERSNLARHLAYQYQGQGELDRALELFTQSLELREQVGFALARPSALTSIGDLYRRKGDYAKALEYGQRALAEAERLRADRFVVGALISIGQTHAAAGRREPAMEHLRRARSLAEGRGYVSGVRQAGEEMVKLDKGPSRSPP